MEITLTQDLKESLKESLERHIETLIRYRDGDCEPGSGTRAILENDLFMTLRRVDIRTRLLLGEIVLWIAKNLPPESYGSRSKVDAWIAVKRREWAARGKKTIGGRNDRKQNRKITSERSLPKRFKRRKTA